MTPDAQAYAIWTKILNLFQDNKPSRIITLEVEFCNLVQGDMNVLTYAKKLKSYADGLADLEQPVMDSTLVLTMLRSLNPHLCHIASIIKTRTHFRTSSPPDLSSLLRRVISRSSSQVRPLPSTP